MTTQRRSYETGHKPKCLVIVDETAEWDRAVYYASRWAIRVGGGVVMLRIIEIEDQNQQWLGVADIMRAEAEDAANEALDRASGRANGIAAITPERVIREGDPTAQILDVIDKDVDISMLVLAANPGPEGPGPLISMMALGQAGSFPIPVSSFRRSQPMPTSTGCLKGFDSACGIAALRPLTVRWRSPSAKGSPRAGLEPATPGEKPCSFRPKPLPIPPP
jgi:nucleotide-binding universal stress UspA family protein